MFDVAVERDFQFCTEVLVRGDRLPPANEVRAAMRTFGGWVRRIGTNLALDHLRKRRRFVELPAESRLAIAPTEPLLDRERREAIARAFGMLPAGLRAAATLALIEEQPYVDIADALGISVGAVKHRVFRAVRLLRKRLERLGVKP